jgi:hypothetical protein
MEREVQVHRKSRLADPDDPRVRERLESGFSDASSDLVLTAPGLAVVHGPRGLVRANALPSAVDEGPAEHRRLARRLGRELLNRARPELRRCYEAAFARRTMPVTHGTVEASILPDGTVAKARIVEGGLVDGLGDVCLIEHIESTRVAADRSREATRVRLPLTFFYEGTVYIYEGTGETFSGSTGNAVQSVSPQVSAPMPAVDRFTPHGF